MHLLASQSGVIDDGAEAVDLQQSPGDIVVISAADSELAALARAHGALKAPKPSLRLANLMALGHNLSVDTYAEQTLRHARLIIARVLGGRNYWTYGVDTIVSLATEQDIKIVLVPGGADADPELTAFSNVKPDDVERIRQYFSFGGPQNIANLLTFCSGMLDPGTVVTAPPPAPLPPAGLYWPGYAQANRQRIEQSWRPDAPVCAITFYRALIEGGLTDPIDALIDALRSNGLNPLPLYVSSLKDPASAEEISAQFDIARPAVILNATGFAVANSGRDDAANPFDAYDCPVLQTVFSGTSQQTWQDSSQGLPARDLAMNVVLPELDGRIMTRAVSFKADQDRDDATQCQIITYEPVADRIAFVAQLAANWAKLRGLQPNERRVAIVLANYPNRDGRIGNGVGYDTPASTINIMNSLKHRGYVVDDVPASGNALIEELQAGPTNNPHRSAALPVASLPLRNYLKRFNELPEKTRQSLSERWGEPEQDPFFAGGAFKLPIKLYGNLVVCIQPARGYNIDPKETYHDPALVPPHGYLAFYVWLRDHFGAHAIIHNGKHGNLEWLPGKAVGLSRGCFPEAALGPLPQLYPFIVNDPGEGTQAKRRTSAVIVDHLTPPLSRAETYGPLKDLEALIDEYYLASGLDRRRVDELRQQILDLTRSSGLDADAGIADLRDEDAALQQLDTYICELKEAQIRDGLHILGESPKGDQETGLLVALTRISRGTAEAAGDGSLVQALAQDLELEGFDPLDCALGEPWQGPKPEDLQRVSSDSWRTHGDTVERLELLAAGLVSGSAKRQPEWTRTEAVITSIDETIRPRVRQCGKGEIDAVMAGLDGRFVPPGPSGAPTRGRLDVLPTGRNFYSLDNRSVPTPTAWSIGQKSAGLMLERHFQDHGRYPKALGLSVWGTSNMRTGGDDIAQALALIGAKPVWDTSSWRVTGFEIIPLAALGRPRIDVTLRISGFFRDAFPAQIELFDKAVRAIALLEEDGADNPISARVKQDSAEMQQAGMSAEEAARLSAFRVFGSKPGAYGAGLQALMDEKLWAERADLARAYVTWGAYAYGSQVSGQRSEDAFTRRLKRIEAVVQNQDNREHDLLDSDDYYQFEGGMTAAVEEASGTRPVVYHNDHSRPERPVTRTLEEEIGRVVRSRVVNPKWIAGIMRHGYKGVFEIAATVDYLFAFAATTGAVRSHHFELAYEAYIGDPDIQTFMRENNHEALTETAQRFHEAIERGLWTPKSNSAYHELRRLQEERTA